MHPAIPSERIMHPPSSERIMRPRHQSAWPAASPYPPTVHQNAEHQGSCPALPPYPPYPPLIPPPFSQSTHGCLSALRPTRSAHLAHPATSENLVHEPSTLECAATPSCAPSCPPPQNAPLATAAPCAVPLPHDAPPLPAGTNPATPPCAVQAPGLKLSAAAAFLSTGACRAPHW